MLVEPEAGACRAARLLFDYPVVRATGSAVPAAGRCVDGAWALGVLCTTPHQLEVLRELNRVVRAGRRVGLLVFAARRPLTDDELGDNSFPTRDWLAQMIDRAGMRIEQWRDTTDLPPIPEDWSGRVDTVEGELRRRYGHTDAWRTAETQSSRISGLLESQSVTGELLVVRSGGLG